MFDRSGGEEISDQCLCARLSNIEDDMFGDEILFQSSAAQHKPFSAVTMPPNQIKPTPM